MNTAVEAMTLAEHAMTQSACHGAASSPIDKADLICPRQQSSDEGGRSDSVGRRRITASATGWATALVAALCAAPALAAPGDVLIQGGHVMTMHAPTGDVAGADVLVRDGRIAAIGPDLTAQAGDAQRIDARGKVVMPGFVDVHNHLYVTTMRGQFRNADGKFFPVASRLSAAMTPDDVRVSMRLGALELLHGGVTTTADFFDNVLTPAHGEAGLAALLDSGIRAQMFLGGPDKTTKRPIDLVLLRELVQRQRESELVKVGLAWRLPRDRSSAENWAMRQQEFDAAKALDVPVQVHVSGEPGPMFDALIDRGYLHDDVTVVHATDATARQLQALTKAGGSLALTPISEHRVGYGLTRLDDFKEADRQGLGIDGNALAGSADMFATLRLAALTWSGGAKQETAPDPRALLELATRRGAEAIGLGDQIGTLEVGKRADLQVIDLADINLSGHAGGDPAALIVYSARPDNVDTVLVGGRVLKADGALTRADMPAVIREANESARSLRERSTAL